MFSRILLLIGLILFVPFPAHAEGVQFIASAYLDGKGTDKSGLPSIFLEDGVSPLNGLNGFGSGMAYTGYQNRFVLLPDRGPNKIEYKGGVDIDFTTSYQNRIQTFDISVMQDSSRPTGWRIDLTHVGTTLLKNTIGEQYLGISTAFAKDGKANRRFDPEGISIAPDGTFWISDEYGPYILHFDQTGQQIGQLQAPDGFEIASPGPNLKTEMTKNKIGRVTNRGAEGLTVTPGGRYVAFAMQSPLLQDGGQKSVNSRIVIYDLQNISMPPRQFVYPFDNTKMGISEILAVDETRFLVNERDPNAGNEGRKLLYLIDILQSEKPTELTQAGYVGTSGKTLPESGLPEGVIALKKTLFADIGKILNKAQEEGKGAFANARGLPDKIEGYAWGPDLPNGDHLLLACNDNDFDSLENGFPNYFFAFAVPPSALPGLKITKLNDGVKFGP
jgi:hypothetical protein